MNKKKTKSEKQFTLYERIFYNNKLMLVLSFVLAIVLWAVVKVNYSENATRVISNVLVNLDESLAKENDFERFPKTNDEDILVSVTVSGKAFDINTYSLSRDDIQIAASSGYIDSAGYKTLTLTPSIESGINIVKIEPSVITVYFDRRRTTQVNVEAKLTNKIESLVADGYTIGQLAPSVNTATVTGPATVVDNLKKIYFEATVEEEKLPLTETTEVTAQINYALEKQRASQFLKCDNVGTEANPATVTIPVYKVSKVPTVVKFVNQPAAFDDNPPIVTITPAEVEISYTPDGEDYTSFAVGTIDFRDLKAGVNKFRLTAADSDAALLNGKAEESFLVLVDLRNMKNKVLDATASNVVYLNQSSDKKYTANLLLDGLTELTVVGSPQSLEKLTVENLQIEINVSSLKTDTQAWQTVPVSNISISSDTFKDCWVYGSYGARVRVSAK